VQRFNGRVRVIQVLTDNSTRTGVDEAFCSSWQSRYSLTNVKVLMDPTKSFYRFFTFGMSGTVTINLPAMALFDRAGTVRWTRFGASLTQAQAEINNVLSGG
jgi:hypothetical protein